MKIMVINGPNLNMLGIREPEIYGREAYDGLVGMIEQYASEHNIDVLVKQSNSEGEIVTLIQSTYGIYDGIVINPAAYTHYSYAIYDAIKAVGIPAVEVHISDIMSREDFRRVSVTKDACSSFISGRGFNGYIDAIAYLQKAVK